MAVPYFLLMRVVYLHLFQVNDYPEKKNYEAVLTDDIFNSAGRSLFVAFITYFTNQSTNFLQHL